MKMILEKLERLLLIANRHFRQGYFIVSLIFSSSIIVLIAYFIRNITTCLLYTSTALTLLCCLIALLVILTICGIISSWVLQRYGAALIKQIYIIDTQFSLSLIHI